MGIVVQHDRSARKFLVPMSGGKAVLDYEVLGDGDTLDYRSTYVPEPERGNGVASEITQQALDYAKRNGKKVKPSCPFVKRFIEENDEYESVVATSA